MPKTAAAVAVPNAPPTVALSLIQPNPNNPRKHFDEKKLAELAEDIRQHGVMQPIEVRPIPGGSEFELVFGERRLRAAKLAGLDAIPAMVREWSDAEVAERQLVENLHREDLHPLEEAEGVLALHMKHGLDVDAIGERVKKSPEWVYSRLKLCALIEPAKKALGEKRLTTWSAIELARYPAEVQGKALKQVLAGSLDGEPMPQRQVLDLLRREFLLELKGAAFDPSDADLVPAAGACPNCTKRTGAQAQLFGEVKEKDLCTDGGCYRAKVAADWKAREAAAAAGTGPGVVPMAESARIFDEWGNLAGDAPYVKAEASCYDDAKYRTYKALLGKSAKPAIVMASTPKGIIELLPKKGLKELLDDAGRIERQKSSASSPASSKEAKAERAAEEKKAAVRREALRRGVGLIVGKVEAKEPDKKFWRMLAEELLHQGFLEQTLERRFPEQEGDAAKKWVEKASAEQLRGFVFEGVMEPTLYPTAFAAPSAAKALKEVCEFFRVDLKKLEADVKADAKKPEHVEKAEALFKPKKGVCRVCNCTDTKPCKVEGLPEGCAWVDEEETLCTECVELEPGDKPHGKGEGKKKEKS